MNKDTYTVLYYELIIKLRIGYQIPIRKSNRDEEINSRYNQTHTHD